MVLKTTIVTLSVGNMTCSSCSKMVETTLLKVPKVQSARVNLMTAQAVVEIVNDEDDDIESNTVASTLIDALEEIGKEASMVSMEETRDDDTAGSILPNQQQQQRRVQYQFALQGLTCSSCQSTVDQAIRSMQHVTSVQVSLFPEATLRMVVIDRELVTPEHVISIIEDVGFDAVLVHQESLDEGLSSNKDSRRVVLLTFADAQDAHEARTFLLDVDCVQEVSFVEEMSKPKKKMTIMPSKMNYKRGFIYMDEEAVGQATVESTSCILRVTFVESLEMGIRTLLRAVEEHVGVASKAAIKVQDAVGFQTNQEAAEARRRLEIARERRDFFFALAFTIPVTIIAMVLGMIPSTMHYVDKIAVWHITWEELTTWILTTPVQFISGFRFYRESYYSLKTGHYGMGLLICLGTSAAYFYSVGALLYNATGSQVTERLSMAFETSALLITFVILGKYLEHKAKARTSKAISSLAKLSPQFATLVGTWNVVKEQEEDCPEEVVDCILVQRDDILMVKPGENVPSDGVVVNGCTSIDESMLTGESMPVVKQPGDAVIGGTVNLEGSIRIRVTKVGGDTAMAQIIRLIESAQSSKAPIQDFADRVAGRFVPMVLFISLTTFTLWAILLNTSALDNVKGSWSYLDHGLNDWTLPLVFAISVLVISCPCALGLATPTAIMVGSGVGARNGILLKSGRAIEASKNIKAVVFDKTGTLTFGRPTVNDVLLLSDRCASFFETTYDEKFLSTLPKAHGSRMKTLENIFYLAASAEHGSEHPLAKGIITKAEEIGIGEGLARQLTRPDDFVSEPGQGIQCTIEGHQVHVGNRRNLKSNKIEFGQDTMDAMEYLENKGQTAVVVSVDGKAEAVIGLMDKAKDEASTTVNVLSRALGIDVFMLTGDNFRTARVVASDLGLSLENVIADVLPEGKVDCIKSLQKRYGDSVAFVGDGVNDAAALEVANLGIAVAAGTNVAIESASIVLINSYLTDVVTAIHLSKYIYRRIKWNFVWAFGYNVLAIPLAAGVFYPLMDTVIPPYVAGLAMVLSSLTVLSSSLLLNKYQPPKYAKEYKRVDEGVALDKVHMTAVDKKVTIQCESMRSGGACSCSPTTCNCDDCPEHPNCNQNQKMPPNLDIYPGCQSSWGKGCNCDENCKCGPGCKCCHEPRAPKNYLSVSNPVDSSIWL